MSTTTFSPTTASAPNEKKTRPLPPGARIVVVGAGAFGGWTALLLMRKGFYVTLVDCWGPGNSRSSSGDETRVIRSTYGANELYFDLNVRALQLWKEHERQWSRQIFHPTGVLWMCHEATAPIVDDSIPFAKKHGMEYEYLSPSQLHKKFPVLQSADLHHGWFDPHGGFLKARESTQLVLQSFLKEGGKFIMASVTPPTVEHLQSHSVVLHDGRTISGDVFIFAGGAWLGKMFPNILAPLVIATRQEVFYFGVPAETNEAFEALPVWVDLDGKDFYYGIPGNAHRGFKVGVDRRGKIIDPTHDNRVSEPEVLAHVRQFLRHRFPGLQNAPVVESRVCAYENSPDGNFIFDQHPDAEQVWLLGGGSGHGFKHGPALGEWVATSFEKAVTIPPLWRIDSKK